MDIILQYWKSFNSFLQKNIGPDLLIKLQIILETQILSLLITFIFIATIMIIAIKPKNIFLVKVISGSIFFLSMVFSLVIWYLFDPEETGFQFINAIPLIQTYCIDFIIGIDGISLCFLLLTTFIMLLCWFAALQVKINYREFIICLLLIELFLILSFVMIDLFFFTYFSKAF